MNFKILSTQLFENKLEQILLSVKENESHKASEEFLNFVEVQLNNLSEFPELGKQLIDRTYEKYRFIILKNFVVSYKFDKKQKSVFLLSIDPASDTTLALLEK